MAGWLQWIGTLKAKCGLAIAGQTHYCISNYWNTYLGLLELVQFIRCPMRTHFSMVQIQLPFWLAWMLCSFQGHKV